MALLDKYGGVLCTVLPYVVFMHFYVQEMYHQRLINCTKVHSINEFTMFSHTHCLLNILSLEFKLNGYNSWFGFADGSNGSADSIDPENPKEDDESNESSSFASNDAVRKRNSVNGTSH